MEAEELLRQLRRVVHRLKGPEGYYLQQQYGLEIKQYLDSGQYDKILALRLRYDIVEMPIRTLRQIARHHGISYYTSMTRYDLVRAIQNATAGNLANPTP